MLVKKGIFYQHIMNRNSNIGKVFIDTYLSLIKGNASVVQKGQLLKYLCFIGLQVAVKRIYCYDEKKNDDKKKDSKNPGDPFDKRAFFRWNWFSWLFTHSSKISLVTMYIIPF